MYLHWFNEVHREDALDAVQFASPPAVRIAVINQVDDITAVKSQVAFLLPFKVTDSANLTLSAIASLSAIPVIRRLVISALLSTVTIVRRLVITILLGTIPVICWLVISALLGTVAVVSGLVVFILLSAVTTIVRWCRLDWCRSHGWLWWELLLLLLLLHRRVVEFAEALSTRHFLARCAALTPRLRVCSTLSVWRLSVCVECSALLFQSRIPNTGVAFVALLPFVGSLLPPRFLLLLDCVALVAQPCHFLFSVALEHCFVGLAVLLQFGFSLLLSLLFLVPVLCNANRMVKRKRS